MTNKKTFTELIQSLKKSGVDKRGILSKVKTDPSILTDIEETYKEYDYDHLEHILTREEKGYHTNLENKEIRYKYYKGGTIYLKLQESKTRVRVDKVKVVLRGKEVIEYSDVTDILEKLGIADKFNAEDITEYYGEYTTRTFVVRCAEFTKLVNKYTGIQYVKNALEKIEQTRAIEVSLETPTTIELEIKGNGVYEVRLDIDNVNVEVQRKNETGTDTRRQVILPFKSVLSTEDIEDSLIYLIDHIYMFNRIVQLEKVLKELEIYDYTKPYPFNLTNPRHIRYDKENELVKVTYLDLVVTLRNEDTEPQDRPYKLEYGNHLEEEFETLKDVRTVLEYIKKNELL